MMWRSVAVLAAGLLTAAVLTVPAGSARAASSDGTLTVVTNRDYVGSGVYDPAIDVPQAGISVSVSDASGHTATGVTDATGSYVLTASSTLVGSTYRVQTTIPAALSYLQPALAITGGGFSSATSFVTVAAGASATVRIGVWDPADFTQLNPTVATVVQAYNGGVGNNAQSNPDAPGQDETRGVITVPYADRYESRPGLVVAATQLQVGTSYGLAYQRSSKKIFSSAFAKSHTLYTSAGPGAIYVSNVDGSGSTLFTTVPNAGIAVHDAVSQYDDSAFFDANGTQSLGGLALSEDGLTLSVVNLNDRKLYSFDATTRVQKAAVAIPDPGCANGNWRPFALRTHNAALYVGGTCDASTGTRADLKAVLYRFDGTTFTSIFSHALTDLRGAVLTGSSAGDTWTHWNPWIASIADSSKAVQQGRSFVYPQPELSGLVFDRDGSLTLGLRDRTTDQVGQGTADPRPADAGQSAYAASGGEIAKACLNTDGTYSWQGTNGCPINNIQNPNNNDGNEDPAVQEFYVGDFAYPYSQETASGAVASALREPDVISTQVDPTAKYNNDLNTQGISFYDRATGIGGGNDQNNRGLILTGAYANSTIGGFGKGNALGDLVVLAHQAPVEIGNRVWSDANGNGIQDANEPGIAGVTVQLTDSTGAVVGSAVTDAQGEYYFSSGEGTSTASTVVGLPLTTKTAYTVVLPQTNFAAAGALAGQGLTVAAAGADRTIDSNGIAQSNGSVSAAVTTGAAGSVDHSIDFGFVPGSYAVGDFVWSDTNRDGIQDPGEPGVAGVTVTLLGADGVTAATHGDGSAVVAAVTNAAGHYVFSGLVAGSYTEKFTTLPAGFGFTAQQVSAGTSANDSNPAVTTGLTPVFTLGPVGSANPDMRVPVAADGAGTAVAINPTIDAGIIAAKVSVGDFVWSDTNRDGIQNVGEPGIAGVVLTLTGPDGNPVTDINGNPVGTTTTAADGSYHFTNLPALPAGQHYTVTVTPPTGYIATLPQAPGSTTANDSSTGSATSTDLTTDGATDYTLDFGFVKPLFAVGDFVWRDENGNGIQDAFEPSIPGVTVTLKDADGVVIASTKTNSTGYYHFDDLPAGSYSEVFTAPATWQFTQQGAGADRTLDSNVNSAGVTGIFTLALPAADNNVTPSIATDGVKASFIDRTIDAGIRSQIDIDGGTVPPPPPTTSPTAPTTSTTAPTTSPTAPTTSTTAPTTSQSVQDTSTSGTSATPTTSSIASGTTTTTAISPDGLAFTGVTLVSKLWWAIVLLAMGGLILVFSRRRQQSARHR